MVSVGLVGGFGGCLWGLDGFLGVVGCVLGWLCCYGVFVGVLRV